MGHHRLPAKEEREMTWQRELQSSAPLSLKCSVVVAGWAGVNKAIGISPSLYPCPFPDLKSLAGVHWRGTTFVPVLRSLWFWLSAGFGEIPECILSLPLPERVTPGFWKALVDRAERCYRNATHYMMWLKDLRGNLNLAIDLFPLLQKELLCLSTWYLLNTTMLPYTRSTPWTFSLTWQLLFDSDLCLDTTYGSKNGWTWTFLWKINTVFKRGSTTKHLCGFC